MTRTVYAVSGTDRGIVTSRVEKARECVELCIAAGDTRDDISIVVGQEIEASDIGPERCASTRDPRRIL